MPSTPARSCARAPSRPSIPLYSYHASLPPSVPPSRPAVCYINPFPIMTRDEAAVASESSDDDVPGLVDEATPEGAAAAKDADGDAGTRDGRPADRSGLAISAI